ncbi:survival motor neuron protein-like isoform X6 [Lepus europaeus]|uniref:survival motor neuron protein-like isoform X6 n=1 Tax=Lepus europaeus TaxID=9983 RepID=UPI002B4A5E00|nr:survival motor neuron protein-like isoform X6 [Lepus europaeus]
MKLKGQKKKIPVLILHLGLKMKPLKMAYQNRRLPGAIDVIGQTITISRVEGRRRANENSNIQVLSERCAAEVDNNFSKPPPFFPPGGPPTHLPPPPFLPPPPTVSTAPPLIPPPVAACSHLLEIAEHHQAPPEQRTPTSSLMCHTKSQGAIRSGKSEQNISSFKITTKAREQL